jgi:REP element-mobilizing transposase RayT
LRIERAGGWYHLTSRGNERRAMDRDNRDRAHFCALLGEMVARFRVRLHGFVLMDNHDHLIYVESAGREGWNRRPWEKLRDQVVLGGEPFLQELRGHRRLVQRGLVGLPRLEAVLLLPVEYVRAALDVLVVPSCICFQAGKNHGKSSHGASETPARRSRWRGPFHGRRSDCYGVEQCPR